MLKSVLLSVVHSAHDGYSKRLKSVLLSVVHSALTVTLTVKEWTTDSSRLLHFSSLILKKCSMDSSLLMRNASSPLMNFTLQI